MRDPELPSWKWPRFRWRSSLTVLGLCALLGLWQGVTVYLSGLNHGSTRPLLPPLVEEFTALLAAFIGLPIPMTAALNAPRPAGQWNRFIRLHLLGYSAYALLVPSLFIPLRHVVFPMLGWGTYDYGNLQTQLPMEWMKLLLAYAVSAGAFIFAAHLRESQLRAQQEAELRSHLQEAQFQALSAQLDPHFLFNALNTISSILHDAPKRADHLLASLAQMLRDSLAAATPWTLTRELNHLEAYLDFARARFEDRLEVTLDVRTSAGTIQVPRYCIQRLVENALKHNQDLHDRILHIDISIGQEAGRLVLEVADTGQGFAHPERALEGSGLGLRNLKDSLVLQSGPRSGLEICNQPSGGAKVRVFVEAPGG